MKTAKLFKNGRSQAVRLPKEFQFNGNDVFIKKINNIVMLFSKNDPWAPLINSLDQFSDDFIEERNQPAVNERDSF
jgi:antitoxin VapB